MTPSQLILELIEGFIDQNGLVCPHKGDKNSQNGVMFTSIFSILTGKRIIMFDSAIEKCFKEPGLLLRTPDNTGGQEQFDNYLALAVAAIHTGSTEWAKEILMYGIKHFFVFDTDNKPEFQDFLGRFIHVWPMMFAAAFPKWKWLTFLPLTVFAALQKAGKIPEVGSSKMQLQWVFLQGYYKLFGGSLYHSWYESAEKLNGEFPVEQIFATYYGKDHPYTRYLAAE